jgi:ferredoxin--NADP+ reductase
LPLLVPANWSLSCLFASIVHGEYKTARQLLTGNAWLVLEVPVTGGLLYPQEIDAITMNNLEVTYAISREMKNQQGGKLYVQDALAEQADKLFD